jgi:hypothetical protein
VSSIDVELSEPEVRLNLMRPHPVTPMILWRRTPYFNGACRPLKLNETLVMKFSYRKSRLRTKEAG